MSIDPVSLSIRTESSEQTETQIRRRIIVTFIFYNLDESCPITPFAITRRTPTTSTLKFNLATANAYFFWKVILALPLYGQIQQTSNWWYFFLIFPENGIWHLYFRQLARNVKTCLLGKILKTYFYMTCTENFTQSAKREREIECRLLQFCLAFLRVNSGPAESGYALPLQTVQSQIRWLLKKPTDLDLHCSS